MVLYNLYLWRLTFLIVFYNSYFCGLLDVYVTKRGWIDLAKGNN